MQSKDNKPAAGKSESRALSPAQQVIEITYADDGTPQADRHEVAAESGAEIVWHGPVDTDTPFSILFEQDPSVAGQPNGLELQSSLSDGRHTAQMVTKYVDAPETYQYFMLANGRRSDPIIVVNPIILVPQKGKDSDPDDDD